MPTNIGNSPRHNNIADPTALTIKPLKYQKQPHRAWTDSELAIMTGPDAGLVALPVQVALFTGQRLGDVLGLRSTAYDGQSVRVRQQKTGTELTIAVHPTLAAMLDDTPRIAEVICTRPDGAPWKIDHFKHVFADTRARLGLPDDVHFHGLRHSAASRLAEAGCSHAEIAAVTGYKSVAMVAHYAAGAQQRALAKSAIGRLKPAAKPADESPQ